MNANDKRLLALALAAKDGATDGQLYAIENLEPYNPGSVLPDESLINALGGEAVGRRWGIEWYDADGVVSEIASECCDAYNRAFAEAAML